MTFNPLLVQMKLKASKTYEKIKEIQICMIHIIIDLCRGVILSKKEDFAN